MVVASAGSSVSPGSPRAKPIRSSATETSWASPLSPMPLRTVTSTRLGVSSPGGRPRNTLRMRSASRSSSASTEAPPAVRNGVAGRLNVCSDSASKLAKRRPRVSRSPASRVGSRPTKSTPTLTRSLSVAGFVRPLLTALEIAFRMNSCWRVMRPRSPLGSVRQRPVSGSWISRWRERTKARACCPSSSKQPGESTRRPEKSSRTGSEKYTGTPPTALTRPRKPTRSTST